MIYCCNEPDVVAMRERAHEKDLAVWGLMGAVLAIVDGAKFPKYIGEAYRLEQLADALAKAQAKIADAEARYEATLAALRVAQVAAPENDLTGI
jgi:hypothetical protein